MKYLKLPRFELNFELNFDLFWNLNIGKDFLSILHILLCLDCA